jgi:hypothetical protein
MPQSSSQELGWAFCPRDSSYRKSPKNVVTGMYNWSSSRPAKLRDQSLDCKEHTLGFITLVGDDSHPKKRVPRRFNVDSRKTKEGLVKGGLDEVSQELKEFKDAMADLPGDYRMKPYEWKYVASKISADREPREEPITSGADPCNSSSAACSIPTTVVRNIDSEMALLMNKQRQFLNRSKANKWYHPLNSNEVSRYGDAYVKVMHFGPYSKSQLLVSR